MTLLVTAVTRNHAFHASDQLVTYGHAGLIVEHDRRANKTIVIVGSDCWLVLGYTGVAYIDARPTDQFIAEAVSGVADLSKGGILMRGHGQPLRIHFEKIGRRIVESVDAAFRRLPSAAQKHKLILIGSGLQFTKPAWRHIIFKVEFDEKKWDSVGDSGRWPSWNSFALNAAGDVREPIIKRARERVKAEGSESPERIRSIMVDAVRETGAASKLVGENVISVILAPEQSEIGVYLDLSDAGPTIESPSTDPDRILPPPAVYTPFVLLPSAVHCPSIASAGVCRVDGLALKFYGPASTVGGGFLHGYDREPPPGVRRGRPN
ncbi:hypothetical protein [Nocardia salmonicida]|uniref:hypothetical protein n=1 Tax=Nocardia salmonicida TaxID=53431 RepID=UPI0012F4B519|nr:hypothetical protein [Nocardia salmonicida]